MDKALAGGVFANAGSSEQISRGCRLAEGNPGAMRRKVWVLGLTQLAPLAGPFQKGSESCLEQVDVVPRDSEEASDISMV